MPAPRILDAAAASQVVRARVKGAGATSLEEEQEDRETSTSAAGTEAGSGGDAPTDPAQTVGRRATLSPDRPKGPLTSSVDEGEGMNEQDHDWITLHRVRFAAPIAARDRSFPPVAGASVWRFCPQHVPGADGLTTLTSEIWGGLGIWDSRAEAEAMLADPGAAIPWLGEAEAAWHCLAVPVSHRGKVNWRGHVENGTAVRPAPVDPGGPLVVVTTAGFLSRDNETLPRIKRFVEGVSEVMAWYGALPSNLRNDVFNGPDGRGGFTCSLWRSDEAMREAAYYDGRHRARMEQNRAGLMFDYSSFTRLRALDGHGDWDGDPFAELQEGAMT